MSKPISVESAEHYKWGAACDGWHFVRTDGLSVISERMPPGTREVRHRHGKSRQFFYVLAGRLEMEVDGSIHVLGAGTGIEIAPGIAHQATNRSERDVAFLVVSQPPSHGDREPAPPAA